MNLTKKNITKEISRKTNISNDDARGILDFFLSEIKKQSISKIVKLSRFGSFIVKATPKRMGRNPKTKESYIIVRRKKLMFIASKKIKDLIN